MTGFRARGIVPRWVLGGPGRVLDLAQKAPAGEVDFARIAMMEDGEVIAQLTAVKGIGVWTAKMFLLFHLGRPDVLPSRISGSRSRSRGAMA